MTRWSFMSRFTVIQNGEPYLWRLRLVSTPLCSVWLHRIYGPDTDPDPHDHPRPFIKLQLSGCYTEHLYTDPGRPGGLRHHEARDHWPLSVHIMRRGWAHKIVRTCEYRPVRTLLITGRQRPGWNFWTPDGPVPWQEYLGMRNGQARQEE